MAENRGDDPGRVRRLATVDDTAALAEPPKEIA
jgi:hypothetical protein